MSVFLERYCTNVNIVHFTMWQVLRGGVEAVCVLEQWSCSISSNWRWQYLCGLILVACQTPYNKDILGHGSSRTLNQASNFSLLEKLPSPEQPGNTYQTLQLVVCVTKQMLGEEGTCWFWNMVTLFTTRQREELNVWTWQKIARHKELGLSNLELSETFPNSDWKQWDKGPHHEGYPRVDAHNNVFATDLQCDPSLWMKQIDCEPKTCSVVLF